MNPVPILKYVATGIGGAAIGSVVTYFVANRILSKKWQAIADEQVASVKEHYRIIRKEDELSDPENLVNLPEQHRGADFDENYPKDPEALQELADALLDAGYTTVVESVNGGDSDAELIAKLEKQRVAHFDDRKVKDVVARNVFERTLPEGPDGAPNDPNFPYVISIDEFAAPESDIHAAFETVTIKYHVGDNTLLDSQGGIELDVNGTVGVENLKKFGHMSQDEDIVYVRNERLGLVFEIVRIEVGYAESRGMSFDPDEEDGHIKQRRKVKDRQATAEFKES